MSQIKRILVIRFGAIGDIVLTVPFWRGLRACYPESETFFLTKRAYAKVLSGQPEIDQIIEFDPDGGSLSHLVAQLRARRFDLVIDLHANLRSRVITMALLGMAKCRVYHKGSVHRRLYLRFPALRSLAYFNKVKPVYQRYMDTLQQPDSPVVNNYRIPSHTSLPPDLKDWLAQGEGPVIGVSPGAGRKTKIWPHYRELCAQIKAGTAQRVVLFGGPGDRELCRDVAAVLPSERVWNSCGRLTIPQCALLMTRCGVVISNDSGLMHMAAACHVPLAAFFGPTTRYFGFMPLSTQVVLFERELVCRPCSLHGADQCPRDSFECLAAITAAEVFKKLQATGWLESKDTGNYSAQSKNSKQGDQN